MKNKFSGKSFIISIAICIIYLLVKNSITPKMSQIDSGIPGMVRRQQVDDLYIGSSLFRKGLDSSVLDGTEEDYFIVIYNANQPIFEYWELEKLLQNNCTFEKVYVDLYPYTAVHEPWLSDKRLLYDTDLKDKIEIWSELSNSKEADFSAVWEFFVSSNNELFVLNPLYQRLVAPYYYKGINTQEEIGLTEEQASRLEAPRFESIELHEKQKGALADMIQLCKENNIDIVFVETPKYKKLSQSEDYQTIMNTLVEFVISNGADCILHEDTFIRLKNEGNSESIVWYSFENDVADNYLDTLHLSTKGRIEFSKVLCAIEG